MLKLIGDWIYQRLEMIFKTCIRNGRFPPGRKKAIVVPIHKKDDKQTIENNGKIFELNQLLSINHEMVFTVK